MKFTFGQRPAEFGQFNNRLENHGEGKVKAIDLPVRFAVRIGKELNMIVPTGTPKGTTFSQFLYGPNARKPQLSCLVLGPMKVHRKPEHLKVTLWDEELNKTKRITFEGVTFKDPVLEFEQDGIYCSGKLQIHPTTEQLSRIVDGVEAKTRQLEIISTAPELFESEEEEEEDGGQTDIDDEEEEEEAGGDNDD